MAVYAHLLHTVPVHQGIRVSKVSLVVLVITHHELAVGLQVKLLVEGLVLMAPLVAMAPVGVAVSSSHATMTIVRLIGEVQEVVQADPFGFTILKRAQLRTAILGYLFPSSSPAVPNCRPPPLWGGLLSKLLLFCELVRRGPGKLSLFWKEGSRLRLWRLGPPLFLPSVLGLESPGVGPVELERGGTLLLALIFGFFSMMAVVLLLQEERRPSPGQRASELSSINWENRESERVVGAGQAAKALILF